LADKYIHLVSNLKDEFSRRFLDFYLLEKDFALLTMPFSIDVSDVPVQLQIELIDMQSDISLKEKFKESELLQFWSSLKNDKFLNLKNFARKMFTIFASTFICEQTFSTMNINKSKYRSQLTDVN
jgi:17beta-estradiol 17-dehydrogenase/3beta-hydroxysteroid 3-dehydrogenase/mitotic-spindle organizing protein 1